MGFEISEVLGGGGGGSSNSKKKIIMIGGVAILLFVVFKRSQPQAETMTQEPLNPEVMDVPYYPNMDQQDLDQQFMNYTALMSQDYTNKFLTINDNLLTLQQHMDTQNAGLQSAITNGISNALKDQTKTTTPVTPVTAPKTSSPAPKTSTPTPAKKVTLISAGIKYATPRGGWNSNSIVDYLKSHGYKSDLATRGKYASQVGISNYKGTASQNVQLLSKIKAQK
jgi:hypothetical protein